MVGPHEHFANIRNGEELMGLQSRRGTALLACLFALLLLTLLGSLALSVAQMEMRAASYQQQETAALYLSEAGMHLMFYWLEHPESAPLSLQDLFAAGFAQSEGSLSSGLIENPIVLEVYLGLSRNQEMGGASWSSVWKAIGVAGDTLAIKLCAPLLPGAVATLESTARTAGGVQKTLTVQLVQKGTRLLPMKGSWHEVYE
jgi:hypothetical protein